MVISDFAPIKSVSKSAEVFNKLRGAILSGELLPGTPLKEAHLAKQLNVSQVPVREALLRLEHVGLVVRVADKGTHVTKLTRAEMVQLMEVRSQLEDLAFRAAAKRMTPEIESQLRERLADMENAAASKDHYSYAEADLRFHETVWAASGNPLLKKLLDEICVSVFAFISIQRYLSGEVPYIVPHEKLLNSLLTGNPKEASKCIREHLAPARTIPESIEI